MIKPETRDVSASPSTIVSSYHPILSGQSNSLSGGVLADENILYSDTLDNQVFYFII